MSMTINVENLEKFIREEGQKAATAYAEADKLQKGFVAAGIDPAMDKDAFEKVDAAWKSHSTIADGIAQAQEKLASIKGWGAGGSGGGGDKPIASPEGKGNFGVGRESLGLKMSQRVTASDIYQAALKGGKFDQQDTKLELPAIKVLERTELKTLITGLSDTSAGAFVLADRQDELIDILRRPRIIAGLVTTSNTDSDLIEYVEMTSRTNSAAEVLEATTTSDGNTAAESAVAFAVRQKIVQDISHFIPATKRAMSDAGQMEGILDSEMVDGVLERLDTQIVSGDGNTPNLPGIYNTSGISTLARGGDFGPDAIHKAMTLIRLAYLEPDAIGLHPNDLQKLRLEKDGNGYLFGPPSLPGGGQCWGINMQPSTAFTSGIPLVGAYRRSARLWIREGVTVTMTDSHSDWFIRKILALMGSMRVCFAVVRAGGFCTVTGF